MKNKKIKFWYAYRKDAANHFNVATPTIDLWYKQAKPELITWLYDQMAMREANKIKAVQIKQILEEANNGK